MGDHDHIVIVEEGRGSVMFRYFTQFLKKFITVSSIYLFGYYDFSVGWLVAPIVLSVFRQEWNRRKELKRKATRMLMKDEKKVILSVLGKDLPSWVFFPDVDRAEWLNKMLLQLWPNVTTYASDMIRTTVQAQIKETLENYGMKGFEFGKLRLGTMPPRIGGIKVYERHHARSEIMVDVDLIYSGDCDISFTLKGLSGGIKDFQIHGMMRIILKPLIPVIPFVGGLQIFFLNKPDIDFNLVGVADVLDIPGISDVLRKVIVEQISAMMVLPNKLPIVLSETIPAEKIKTPEPAGILRVHVVKAIQLMKKDVGVLGKGKSDPYVIVTMGAQEFRSKTIDNTVEPKWDFWCEFPLEKSSLEQRNETRIELNVFDKDDSTSKDDFLGWATLKLDDVFVKGTVDKWLTLEGVKHGMVYLRLSYLELSSNVSDLEAALEELRLLQQPSISSAVLIFYLDSVHNLPDAKPNKRPDPVVSLMAGRLTKATGVQFRSSSPVYEQGFMFLIHNPKNESLLIKITDQKTGTELGSFFYSLVWLLESEDMTRDLEPSPINKSGSNCKIVFSAQLKILKKVVGKEADSNGINPTVSTITPPSTPSVTSAASTEVMLPNGVTETSTPKSNDETSKDVQSITNEDNLDTSAQSLESLNVTSSDVDLESSKEEKSTNSFSPLQSPPPSANTTTVSKQKSFSGSIKSSLRKRQPSQMEIRSLGSVEVSLDYNKERQKLGIHIHRASDLYVKDPSDLPDPYVKVYLLPKSEDNKRKTKFVKDSANPTYEEYFEYVLSDDEVHDKKVNISVLSHKSAFYGHNSVLGQVTLTLSELNLNNYRAWYPLEPNGD